MSPEHCEIRGHFGQDLPGPASCGKALPAGGWPLHLLEFSLCELSLRVSLFFRQHLLSSPAYSKQIFTSNPLTGWTNRGQGSRVGKAPLKTIKGLWDRKQDRGNPITEDASNGGRGGGGAERARAEKASQRKWHWILKGKKVKVEARRLWGPAHLQVCYSEFFLKLP